MCPEVIALGGDSVCDTFVRMLKEVGGFKSLEMAGIQKDFFGGEL